MKCKGVELMNSSKRHQGIDLMRILCMLLIIQYHIQGYGSLIIDTSLSPFNQSLVYYLHAICQVAVDGFALISGYVSYHTHQKYSSLILLWLRVLFYSVGVTFVAYLISPAAISSATIKSSFFPLLTGQYWYFTAYFGCFMFTPLIHAAMSHLSFKQATLYLVGILLTFSFLPYLSHTDPFQTVNGNHAIWLLILYAVGMYIQKFDPFSRLSTAVIALLLFCALLLQIFANVILGPFVQLLTGCSVNRWYFLCHDSPTTLIFAVLMLALFSNISFSRNIRILRVLSSSSFSVYLIHDHPLVRKYIVSALGAYLSALPSLLLLPAILAVVLAIYLICTCIDLLREKLFTLLHIRPLLIRIENRLMQ